MYYLSSLYWCKLYAQYTILAWLLPLPPFWWTCLKIFLNVLYHFTWNFEGHSADHLLICPSCSLVLFTEIIICMLKHFSELGDFNFPFHIMVIKDCLLYHLWGNVTIINITKLNLFTKLCYLLAQSWPLISFLPANHWTTMYFQLMEGQSSMN